MPRTVSAEEACSNTWDLLSSVATTKQPIVVAQGDEPLAVVISPEDYQMLVRARGREAIRRLQAQNADNDPDEVLSVVTQIVEEVRRERHEREAHAD